MTTYEPEEVSEPHRPTKMCEEREGEREKEREREREIEIERGRERVKESDLPCATRARNGLH